MGCTRHGSCCHSRASGRWMRHSSCAVACATIAALTATAAAVGAAAVRPAPRQLLSQSRLQLFHASRQLLWQSRPRPWQPCGSSHCMRQGSCCRGRSCSCCTHNGRWCHSHGSGPAAAVRASVAATGRRTQSGFRASVAPWRVESSACGAASALCRRFAAWHVAHLMPPALRRTRWLAAWERVPGARGGLLRKGERAERQHRAYTLGTPLPGARPRMSPAAQGRHAAQTKTTLAQN